MDEADTMVPWDTWHKAAEVGLTSFMLPAEYGGGGATDVVTQALVQEELCAGDIALGNLVTSGGFFAGPVLELGSETQKKRWITPLAGLRPPMAAVAVTEPEVGSDVAAIRTRAMPQDGGYVLSGQKAWISNGGVALCRRPQTTTRAPVLARASAVARPIPVPPPDTRATDPALAPSAEGRRPRPDSTRSPSRVG